MNRFFRWALCAVCVLALCACETKGASDVVAEQETALSRVVQPYVDYTAVATYSNMATTGIQLLRQCQAIQTMVDTAGDYSSQLAAAGELWRTMRSYWQQSAAFLYGPATTHDICRHIDTWPLDFIGIDELLSDSLQIQAIEEEGGYYVGARLSDSLRGFHAAECLLFETILVNDELMGTGKTHAADLTHAEAVYLVGVAADLAQQAVLLEDSWTGGNISEEKKSLIADTLGHSLSFGDNYGLQLLEAGKSGSDYSSHSAVAQRMIAGCVELAGDLADNRLGKAHRGIDPDHISAPFSCTSTLDFTDNILAIWHVYAGNKSGSASISDFVKSLNRDEDTHVRTALEEATEALILIEDFEHNAVNPQVGVAIGKVKALEQILRDEVQPLLAFGK